MGSDKGDGHNPAGCRWLMQSGAWLTSFWLTKGYYTKAEVEAWECSSPVCAITAPLDIEL